MELTLRREFSYYMLTIYVPTCMLVIVSWWVSLLSPPSKTYIARFSFWIDPKAAPARVALGVTTLLTMSTKTASISNSLPPVAYTKVWIKVLQTWRLMFCHFLGCWSLDRSLYFLRFLRSAGVHCGECCYQVWCQGWSPKFCVEHCCQSLRLSRDWKLWKTRICLIMRVMKVSTVTLECYREGDQYINGLFLSRKGSSIVSPFRTPFKNPRCT